MRANLSDYAKGAKVTANQISLPLMVAIPTATYLISGGDLRQTIISACFTALGIIVGAFVNFR